MEAIRELGYEPLEGESIVVKYASENLSDAVSKFFFGGIFILQICESEIVLLNVDLWTAKHKDEISLRIPIEDIKAVTVEENLFNYDIVIHTEEDVISLTTQQKELSRLRASGGIASATDSIFGNKNWHAENLDRTLEKLRTLGKRQVEPSV